MVGALSSVIRSQPVLRSLHGGGAGQFDESSQDAEELGPCLLSGRVASAN
jgi:hypothetical protein